MLNENAALFAVVCALKCVGTTLLCYSMATSLDAKAISLQLAQLLVIRCGGPMTIMRDLSTKYFKKNTLPADLVGVKTRSSSCSPPDL